MRKIVAVIGDSKIEKGGIKYKIAYELGKTLIDNGYRIQTGGLGGIMEAVFMGAKSSSFYREGDTVGIVPSFDKSEVNAFADIVIPTGIDLLRNAIVANADAVIALGGGAGTLSEMAIAWSLHKLIIAFDNVDGWSRELSNRKIDEKNRYPNIDDQVYGVQTAQAAVKVLEKYIDIYTRPHHGIKYRGGSV